MTVKITGEYAIIQIMEHAFFDEFNAKKRDSIAWLEGEYIGLQSGQVAPAMLSKVQVAAYGDKTTLSHCASITVENAKTLSVVPYDAGLLPDIESALREQVSSMHIMVNQNTVRVIAAEMSGEQREVLKKIVKERMEEAKRSLRGAREKVLSEIKKKKASAEISENEEYNLKQDLQERVDEANKEMEDLCTKKLQGVDS